MRTNVKYNRSTHRYYVVLITVNGQEIPTNAVGPTEEVALGIAKEFEAWLESYQPIY